MRRNNKLIKEDWERLIKDFSLVRDITQQEQRMFLGLAEDDDLQAYMDERFEKF